MEDVLPIKSWADLQTTNLNAYPAAKLKYPKKRGSTLSLRRTNDGKIKIKKEEKSTAKTLGTYFIHNVGIFEFSIIHIT